MSEDTVEIKDPKAVLEALERAKNDAKKYREELEALTAEHESAKAELNSIREERRNAAIERAVKDAGADPKRIMQFIKTDDISYENGELKGFDEAFGTVKNALPELFDPRHRVGGRVEMETGNANLTKNVTEMQVDRLLKNLHKG